MGLSSDAQRQYIIRAEADNASRMAKARATAIKRSWVLFSACPNEGGYTLHRTEEPRIFRVDAPTIRPLKAGSEANYWIDLDARTCTCPGWGSLGGICKHLLAVEAASVLGAIVNAPVLEARVFGRRAENPDAEFESDLESVANDGERIRVLDYA